MWRRELGDVREDPYVETVARGLRYLPHALLPINIGPQTFGDPDIRPYIQAHADKNVTLDRIAKPAYEPGETIAVTGVTQLRENMKIRDLAKQKGFDR